MRAVLAIGMAAAAVFVQNETADYIHYRLGVRYKSENKLDQAVEEFRRVLAVYPDNYNAYMHLAEIRLGQGQVKLAVYDLKKALAYNPGWGKAQKLLAAAYEKDGQFENAIMELQLYQQSCDPAEADSIQNRISALVRRSQGRGEGTAPAKGADLPPEAQRMKERRQTSASKPVRANAAVAGSPEAERLFTQSIQLYDEKKYDEALAMIKKVLTAQPGHAGAYYYAGLIRRRNGQNDMARFNFEKALEYPELGYNAHFYLGKILGEGADYAGAVKHLEAYAAKSSYEPGINEAKLLIRKYSDLAEQSVAAGRRQLSLDLEQEMGQAAAIEEQKPPLEIRIDSLLYMAVSDTLSDAGQKMLAGVHAFKAGAFDNAIVAFKKVLIENPSGTTASQCIYNMGVCYFKMRLFKEAENQFQQIIERYPRSEWAPRAYFLKAVCYGERKETAVAEKLFREFIGANRGHEWIGNAYEKLGDAFMDLEQPGKAVDAYDAAVKQGRRVTDRVFAGFKLGTAYFEIANFTRGVEAFREVIALGEKNGVSVRVPDSYYKVADYHYRQKNYTDALDFYTIVTRKYGGFQETPWGLFQIGNIHRNLKDYRKAIDTYQELMKRFPDDYWAKQARWKMEDTVWEHEYRAVLH